MKGLTTPAQNYGRCTACMNKIWALGNLPSFTTDNMDAAVAPPPIFPLHLILLSSCRIGDASSPPSHGLDLYLFYRSPLGSRDLPHGLPTWKFLHSIVPEVGTIWGVDTMNCSRSSMETASRTVSHGFHNG